MSLNHPIMYVSDNYVNIVSEVYGCCCPTFPLLLIYLHDVPLYSVIHVRTRLCTHTHTYLYVHTHLHTHTYTHTHTHIYIYINLFFKINIGVINYEIIILNGFNEK